MFAESSILFQVPFVKLIIYHGWLWWCHVTCRKNMFHTRFPCRQVHVHKCWHVVLTGDGLCCVQHLSIFRVFLFLYVHTWHAAHAAYAYWDLRHLTWTFMSNEQNLYVYVVVCECTHCTVRKTERQTYKQKEDIKTNKMTHYHTDVTVLLQKRCSKKTAANAIDYKWACGYGYRAYWSYVLQTLQHIIGHIGHWHCSIALHIMIMVTCHMSHGQVKVNGSFTLSHGQMERRYMHFITVTVTSYTHSTPTY